MTQITFWSSLSGAEVKRFRNISGLKDIDLLNHFDFPADTFLGHCRGEEVVVATVGVADKALQSSGLPPFEAVVMFSQKDPTAEDSKIVRLQTVAGAPWYLFLNTASGFAVFELNRLFKGGPYNSHNFWTKLSTANHREFYTDGVLNQSAVTPYKLNSMQFNSDELYNFFFLSFERSFVMLNLVETRLSKVRREVSVEGGQQAADEAVRGCAPVLQRESGAQRLGRRSASCPLERLDHVL